jgi:hypothetical protein
MRPVWLDFPEDHSLLSERSPAALGVGRENPRVSHIRKKDFGFIKNDLNRVELNDPTLDA